MPSLVAIGNRGNGEIMVLICHMISRDHEIKGSSNIMGRSPSRLVLILPSLVAIGYVRYMMDT